MTTNVNPMSPEILRTLAADPAGMEFLRYFLVDFCGILKTPMAHTEMDLSYNCGLQAAGFALAEAILPHNPQLYTRLLETPDETS